MIFAAVSLGLLGAAGALALRRASTSTFAENASKVLDKNLKTSNPIGLHHQTQDQSQQEQDEKQEVKLSYETGVAHDECNFNFITETGIADYKDYKPETLFIVVVPTEFFQDTMREAYSKIRMVSTGGEQKLDLAAKKLPNFEIRTGKGGVKYLALKKLGFYSSSTKTGPEILLFPSGVIYRGSGIQDWMYPMVKYMFDTVYGSKKYERVCVVFSLYKIFPQSFEISLSDEQIKSVKNKIAELLSLEVNA